MNYMEVEDQYSMEIIPKREVVIVRGHGARVWDEDGREYIDCVGGHGTANVGHCHPAIIDAITMQAQQLTICPEVFHNNVRAELLKILADISPEGLNQIFLCNSGTESIEAALKFARVATGRQEIIATMRGFHGRTFGALSATWNPKYRKPFEPLLSGFSHVKYNDIEAMEGAISEQTAAVILEIVQGEGGVRSGNGDYFQQVQNVCRERGALLIIDEVQTGFGRTGKMFACDHYDLHPDILCVAKAMAGGLPMGATLCTTAAAAVPLMSHGSTFGGNPVLCAASLATIRVIQEEMLAERAMEMGAYFRECLESIRTPGVREIRGMGFLIGVELKGKVTPFLRGLMARGVMALPAGNTVLRFLPPLVISKEEIDIVVGHVEAILNEVKG
ncbi:MAG: aspartate aminotransferase family protein [Candidatus Latescibacteria bacterium]|nr:aspartate aminotransferase family protein [Candidatus Latescibacterota bacterium]MDP7236377.1 aspartate aminotransferase family protein [Candidatus Latescibacterota bacterium]